MLKFLLFEGFMRESSRVASIWLQLHSQLVGL